MPNPKLIKKLALLATQVGANVQKGQVVVIRTSTEAVELTREVVKSSYDLGASKVVVEWADAYISRDHLLYSPLDVLLDVKPSQIDKYKEFVESGACFISIVSPVPGLNQDVDPVVAGQVSANMSEKINFFRQYMMGNKGQWTIVANSNPVWAKTVYPNIEDENEANLLLWDAIFKASRVDLDSSPVDNWNEHNARLATVNEKLNNLNFDKLHFENSLGTNLTVQLVKNHIWSGGAEHTTGGVQFNPNIPTEEAFTMPHRFGLNGRVYSTMPLNYQGRLIKDFYLDFKDGVVVDFDCEVEKETLAQLLKTDEGSSRAGEIALVDNNSPISQMDTLFNMTLFDENASCHIALGRAYPMNLEGGLEMSEDELVENGYNLSKVHVDFMFGSDDLKITGTKQDGTEILVMENGQFTL